MRPFAVNKRCASLLFFPMALAVISGCGGGGNPVGAPTPGIAPTITLQPANQTVPLSQTGEFTVQATGSAPLTYQWKENGVAISGAELASVTTAPTMIADNGARFTVTVSNSAGSVTSAPATLTLGPRSPKAGDLRFKFVDQPSTYLGGLTNINGTASAPTPGNYKDDAVGAPLEVGPAADMCTSNQCSWRTYFFSAPASVTGLSATFSPGSLAYLQSDIQALLVPSIVISGLDEQSSNGVYAVSYNQLSASSNQPAGFSGSMGSVVPSALQDAASQAGAQGRVITAVTYNATTGNADYLAYGWQNDASTVYESKVVLSSFASVEPDAAALAAGGYIITATGVGPNGGFILVGTRVQGDTLARPFASVSYPTTNPAFGSVVPVAELFDSNGNCYLAEL